MRRLAQVLSLGAAAGVLFLASGCGGSGPPSAAARPSFAPSSVKSLAPSGQDQKPIAPEWSYTSVGKRDPFHRFIDDLEHTQAGLESHCTTPLGRFELVQLRVVAVITGLEDPVAMVETPSGVGYAVRRGACIGRSGGVVASVRSGEVVVAEWTTRADGTRDRTQTSLRLPREASLNLEEQP